MINLNQRPFSGKFVMYIVLMDKNPSRQSLPKIDQQTT